MVGCSESISVCVCVCVCVYIYIVGARERGFVGGCSESERERVCVGGCSEIVCEKERARERESVRDLFIYLDLTQC